MQRKNNFLDAHSKRREYQKGRSGFALIMAIGVVVLLSTILALSLRMTNIVSKSTTDIYLHEQALLLTRSATEYALLAISGYDRVANNGCLNSITATFPTAGASRLFDIQISMQYIGFGGVAGCTNLVGNISTPESNGTVLLDVEVSTAPGVSTEPIRYHRRTLQKI